MEKCGVKAELFERLKKEQLNLPDDQINPFKSGDLSHFKNSGK